MSMIFILGPQTSYAEDDGETPTPEYDPFSDYSEFQQTAEEEADIYFFRYGRLMTFNVNLGYRAFTETLATLYRPDMTYGLHLNYFFDLRFAIYLGFQTSDHNFLLTSGGNNLQGNISISFLSFGTKYYFNTDTLVWPFSTMHPNLVLGFNQTYRTLTLSGLPGAAKDNTLGIEFGGGIEIPILKNQAFLGVVFLYRYFHFSDENQFLLDPVTQLPINIKPRGDSYDILFSLGINF